MSDETLPEPGAPGAPGGAGGDGGSNAGGTGGTGGAGGIGQRGETGQTGATGERGRKGRLSGGAWVIVVVAALVVAGIGVQALLSQNAGESRDEKANRQRVCISEWAEALTDTIKVRSDGSADLREAQTRKDAADDAVTDVFVEAFLTKPTPPQDVLEQHFTEALTEYGAAKANLAEVRATVETTTAQNPYPVLDIDCDPPA